VPPAVVDVGRLGELVGVVAVPLPVPLRERELGVDRDAVQVRQLAGPEARGGPSDDDAAAHRAQIMAWLTRPPGGVVLVA